MISTNVQLQGIDQILAMLRVLPAAFDAGVEDSAGRLHTLAEGATPRSQFTKAHAQDQWGQVERHTGGFSFSNPVDYMGILEEGLYPMEQSPRTLGGYSRQAPGGILGPLVNDETVLQRIAELVVEQLEREINRAGA